MSKKETSVDVKKEKAKAPSQVQGDLWAPLVSLRDEVDRLLEDFKPGSWGRSFWSRAPQTFPPMSDWRMLPAVEVVQCDGDYRITAELPGLTAEDIDVKVSDGSLTIRGQKHEEKKEEKEDYLLSERRYGEVYRNIALPGGVDADAISASFANGVLTVVVPKTAEAKEKERKIKVKAA